MLTKMAAKQDDRSGSIDQQETRPPNAIGISIKELIWDFLEMMVWRRKMTGMDFFVDFED